MANERQRIIFDEVPGNEDLLLIATGGSSGVTIQASMSNSQIEAAVEGLEEYQSCTVTGELTEDNGNYSGQLTLDFDGQDENVNVPALRVLSAAIQRIALNAASGNRTITTPDGSHSFVVDAADNNATAQASARASGDTALTNVVVSGVRTDQTTDPVVHFSNPSGPNSENGQSVWIYEGTTFPGSYVAEGGAPNNQTTDVDGWLISPAIDTTTLEGTIEIIPPDGVVGIYTITYNVIQSPGVHYNKSMQFEIETASGSIVDPMVDPPDAASASLVSNDFATGDPQSASNAFDGDTGTSWLAIGGVNSGGQWLKYNKGTGVVVNQYAIFSPPNNVNNPQSWKLQGSNDDSTWIDLDVKSGQNLPISTRNVFNFSNTTAYQYYRLLVTQTGNGDVRIYELELRVRGGFSSYTGNFDFAFPLAAGDVSAMESSDESDVVSVLQQGGVEHPSVGVVVVRQGGIDVSLEPNILTESGVQEDPIDLGAATEAGWTMDVHVSQVEDLDASITVVVKHSDNADKSSPTTLATLGPFSEAGSARAVSDSATDELKRYVWAEWTIEDGTSPGFAIAVVIGKRKIESN